jgi:hypothetical protein
LAIGQYPRKLGNLRDPATIFLLFSFYAVHTRILSRNGAGGTSAPWINATREAEEPSP